MTTDDSNNSDRPKASSDDDDEPIAAVADNIEAIIALEEESKISLDGFGSDSLNAISMDDDDEEEDDNEYYRKQAIEEANKRYSLGYTTNDEEDHGNGDGKRTNSDIKVTTEDIKFVLDTMKKEAPYDIVSIKQLFFRMASAFTKCPIHHSVNSRKTGAGKTHDLTLVSGYFPKKYVIALAGMSDKALFHRHGVNVIVDENTGNTMPVQPIIDDLKSKIEELEEKNEKENKKQIQKLKSEIQELNDKSQKLIELDNKIFLFLDTAQEGLFNTLMSMISQDSNDQLYEFTDKSGVGKLGSKINRLSLVGKLTARNDR